jgi:hypothetical protein
MELKPYLEDLEGRIVPEVEDGLLGQWKTFLNVGSEQDIFSPRRAAAAPVACGFGEQRFGESRGDGVAAVGAVLAATGRRFRRAVMRARRQSFAARLQRYGKDVSLYRGRRHSPAAFAAPGGRDGVAGGKESTRAGPLPVAGYTARIAKGAV